MSSVPQRIDGPIAVIGDVHGQTDKLRQIIGQLARLPDIHHRWVVFIGDLVDRGPDPAGVVKIYCDLAKQHDRVTWLCGNHEFAMMGALGMLPTPPYIDFAGRWVHNYDSESTFSSWGVPHGDLDALRQAIPESQLQLMRDLPWCIEHPGYFFVHAGLDRNLPFDTQLRILRQRDFTLTHPPWLYSKDFIHAGAPADAPVPVVIGHVPIPQVQSSNGMICTDTGAGNYGELSCVLLPEGQVLQSRSPVDMNRPGFSGASATAPKKPWWQVW